MRISVGKNRFEKVWTTREVTWEQFAKKCSQTLRTNETMEEYKKASKKDQASIKDVGGFVGGIFKDGKRKNGNIECRSMLTLDLDNAVPDVWGVITGVLKCKCLIYSTHKHTHENPRVRLIIPLAREVSAQEYEPISRWVANLIGIEMVDDTCHEAHRLMYWASTSRDGEFVFEEQDGELLSPDEVLATYKDWRDTSEWAFSNRYIQKFNSNIEKQADPREKKGIVGAFCRTYSVTEAIDKFIPDIYQPSVNEGRYHYVKADSMAGVIIYNDTFAYSHHATDPCHGILMNSFDVVRLHKFGYLDEGIVQGTPVVKFPSFTAMRRFAMEDEEVKKELISNSVDDDFKEENKGNNDWLVKLDVDKKGKIKPTLSNLVEIFRNDVSLKGISYNEQTYNIDVKNKNKLPWNRVKDGWSDVDMSALKVYIEKKYYIWSPAKIKDALNTVILERTFHPVREYFEKLPKWDGVKRVETLLIDYLGAKDSKYVRAVTRKTLVAGVARIYEPGVKYDSVLVLTGAQGVGKSMLLSKLGGKWFTDALTLADMKDKSGAEKLQGFWIIELSEMAGMRKVDIESVKSFITRQDDTYRQAYGTVVESHPRQCIICGTSNNNNFLRDITGNRRFLPVEVSRNAKKHPISITQQEIAQIWAETLILYKNGESLTLDKDEVVLADIMQKQALEVDDREGLVKEYLEKKIPKKWASMSLNDRRYFLAGKDINSQEEGTELRQKVCALEIWSECFSKEPSSISKRDSYEIKTIMEKIEGWSAYDGSTTGKLRFGNFGVQKAYVRSKFIE